MSDDPTILFVKPNAIRRSDKDRLASIGVIVIEVADPSAVKFVRASTELSSSALLFAAMEAIQKHRDGYGSDIRKAFSDLVAASILANRPARLSEAPRISSDSR